MKGTMSGRIEQLERTLPPDGLTPFERRMLAKRQTMPPRQWDRLTAEELARVQELGAKCRELFPGKWDLDDLTCDELEALAVLVEKVETR